MPQAAGWAGPFWARIRRYAIVIIAVAGFAMHGGTALLRLDAFYPFPKLVDFGAFYVSAFALRSGLSPYAMPQVWTDALCRAQSIPFHPPTAYNPPFWLLLVQPLTLLSYPQAAWCWTLLNLTLLLWCVWELTRLAGCTTPLARFLGALIVLTFGPVFLDLTLGQTSVILLSISLVSARALAPPRRTGAVATGLAHGTAFGTKVFPLMWVGGLLLLRRWRMVTLSILCIVLVTLVGFVLAPEASSQYWSQVLLRRVSASAQTVSLDDQSLISWLDRLLLAQEYSVPGLRVDEAVRVTWIPHWNLSPQVSHGLGYLLLLAILGGVVYVSWGVPGEESIGAYVLCILYTLILLPHMERYNHTLLLPAIAWLWVRGGRQRTLAVIAYSLAGLARLNHLWSIALPAPWAPLATGFGVGAVLLLMGGLAAGLRQVSVASRRIGV